MKNLIAYCGLNCKDCQARKATVENNDELRKVVAKEWSKLNHVEITPEMINCLGCKADGVKTPFCDSLCPIRKCAKDKKYQNCGECKMLFQCEKIKMIINHNDQALKNLKK